MLNQSIFRDSEGLLVTKPNSTECSCTKNWSFQKEPMWDSTGKRIGKWF